MPRCFLQPVVGPRGGGRRRPCRLPDGPSAEWFKELLVHYGVAQGVCEFGACNASLVALVKAKPDRLHNELAAWPAEAGFLHSFFHEAGDAFTMTIEDVWAMECPLNYYFQQRTAGATASKVSPSSGVAFPVAATDLQPVTRVGACKQDIRLVQHVLRHHGVRRPVPVLYIVQPIADLIVRGAWRTIMGLARWLRAGADAFRYTLPWPAVADLRRLMQQVCASDSAARDAPRLTPALLKKWAEQLKEWSPAILSHCQQQPQQQEDIEGDHEHTSLLLLSMTRSMEAMSRSLQPSAVDLDVSPQMRLIDTLRLAFNLRDRSSLMGVLCKSIALTAPPSMQGILQRRLKEQPRLAASKSKISRSQLYLDGAMMLIERQRVAAKSCYVWLVDSSPQLKRDFLCIKCIAACCHELGELFLKHQQLLRLEAGQQEARGEEHVESSDDDVGAGSKQEPVAERCKLMRDVKRLLKLHVLPPVGLGSGASSLAHKMAAFCHSAYLEAGSVAKLASMASATFAFVVDLGTESGMADYMAAGGAGIQAVLPGWLQQSASDSSDGIKTDVADYSTGSSVQPTGEDAHVFSSALVIAGMCHILNNTDCDVDQAMPYWRLYEKQLQTLFKLVGNMQNLRRFRTHCLEGTAFASKDFLFAHSAKAVAEWRWGSTPRCLR